MENSKADRLIKSIEKMEFGFPAHISGYGVDKKTGLGTPPEKISDEEGIEILLSQ